MAVIGVFGDALAAKVAQVVRSGGVRGKVSAARLFGLGVSSAWASLASTGKLIANAKKAPGSRRGTFLVKVRLLGTSYDFALAIAIPKKMPTMRPALPAAMVAHVPACAAA